MTEIQIIKGEIICLCVVAGSDGGFVSEAT